MTFFSQIRYFFSLLPLLALLGVTYWLNQQMQPEADKSANGKRHGPDAIMENFSAVKMDKQGIPRFIVNARKMQHYPDDDSTELDDPHLTTLSAERPPIHIFAEKGTVSSKGDEVFLRNNVRVVREASEGSEELTLLTDYLHAIPDKDTADTDYPVIIVDAYNIIRAIGLEMDNKARTIKLLAKVKSEHIYKQK